MRAWAVCIGIATLTVSASAAKNGDSRAKAAWEWSIEERVSARTDPILAAERIRLSEQTNPPMPRLAGKSAPSATPAKVFDVIDGNINPELFLPHELFESLLTLGFVLEDNWQSSWQRGVREAGLPPDFWKRLATLSEPYLRELRWRYELLLRGKNNPSVHQEIQNRIVGLTPAICRDRAVALAKARAVFGPKFDRFLYTTIARGRTVVSDTPTDGERYLKEARGCE